MRPDFIPEPALQQVVIERPTPKAPPLFPLKNIPDMPPWHGRQPPTKAS